MSFKEDNECVAETNKILKENKDLKSKLEDFDKMKNFLSKKFKLDFDKEKIKK